MDTILVNTKKSRYKNAKLFVMKTASVKLLSSASITEEKGQNTNQDSASCKTMTILQDVMELNTILTYISGSLVQSRR